MLNVRLKPDCPDAAASFAATSLMVQSFQVAKMIQVAASLRVADLVDDGPVPVHDLARSCGADPAMLLRLCRALAAVDIFEVDPLGNVSQTPNSAWLRETAEPTLYHAALFWTMPGNWAAWSNLEHTIRTGEPAFELTHGRPRFDYLRDNPVEAGLFDSFMQHCPDDHHWAVTEAYDFAGARTVVDVGGGNGALLASILSANPETRGVLFDRENVVARAALDSVAGRCSLHPGDFFDGVPPGGDIYTLSRILHDWSDERCIEILGRCRAAMAPGARLLVIERLMDGHNQHTDPIAYLTDMHMMALYPGARERGRQEFERLFQPNGLELARVVPTRSPYSIIEARAA